ncbi:MAG: response regulator [Nitrospirota bacterium]
MVRGSSSSPCRPREDRRLRSTFAESPVVCTICDRSSSGTRPPAARRRLRQILVNLIGNAIKFTSAGEVFLHVTREAQNGVDLLRFTIKDTGIGIPEMVQGRLFHAFVQADSSTTRRFGGTGLGLAICQRLVSQMHGQIGVESHPGQGSTCWFTAQFPETTIATPPSPFSWSRLHGRRILLVNHCDTVRQALRQNLTSHGMNCTVAQSGPEAVESARTAAASQNPFDLALIELHLSDVDGFETAAWLKQDPATAGAPANAEPPPLSTRHNLAESQPATKPRLLLAEDNPVNQKVACKMLEKLGYRVDVAGNGQEAVAAHERSRYPLIFMDCQMPEVDGFEATALIRKMEGRSAHTPIVAMTANAMQGDRERCLAAGMDDYIAKPVRPKDLQTVLDTWLPKRDQASAA